MIVEWVVGVFSAVLSWLLGLFAFAMPSWFTSSVAAIGDWLSGAGQFGQWIPLGAVVDTITFLLAAYALSWAIRLGRITLSTFTGGGGSAG